MRYRTIDAMLFETAGHENWIVRVINSEEDAVTIDIWRWIWFFSVRVSVRVFRQKNMEGNSRIEEVVRDYFWKGYKYNDILALLRTVHHYETTIDRVRGLLRKLGLRRRGVEIQLEDVESAIEVAKKQIS